MKWRFHLRAMGALSCLFIGCTRFQEGNNAQSSEEFSYAGSVTCKSCHESIYKSHQFTAHHQTSQFPDSVSIKGSFEERANVFFYSMEKFVVMSKEHNQFAQTLYVRGNKVKSKTIDLVVGSGVRGQAYLTWRDSTLFQLPIGYFTDVHSWANSPGFSNRPIFNRPITSRCLECHSTFFNKVLSDKYPEQFSKKNFVLGIECEKCHGPGLKHTNFHKENAGLSEGKFIVSFKKLTREQQLDFCRSCHGGKMEATKPAFSFKVGNHLNDHFAIDSIQVSAPLDSHGNQYGMLSLSKCFLKSDMTCSTCHQSHENERGKVELFSSRCMNCHAEGSGSFCSYKKLSLPQLKQNCIQCHMPEKNSNSIRMLLQGDDIPTPAKMRVHYITMYQDEVIKYINSIPLSKN